MYYIWLTNTNWTQLRRTHDSIRHASRLHAKVTLGSIAPNSPNSASKATRSAIQTILSRRIRHYFSFITTSAPFIVAAPTDNRSAKSFGILTSRPCWWSSQCTTLWPYFPHLKQFHIISHYNLFSPCRAKPVEQLAFSPFFCQYRLTRLKFCCSF